MNVEEVFPKVREIVADVLAIDEDEVELNKSLVTDLGAESIDFLDLVFKLEREFKIKIPRGQIETESRGNLSESEFSQNGVITPAGLTSLRNYLSEVPPEKFRPGLKLNDIPGLFTVETFCKVVVNALAKQQA